VKTAIMIEFLQRNARNLRFATLPLVALALFLLPPTEAHSDLRNSPASVNETTTPDTLRIPVFQGWNLISLPIIVPNGRARVLFPSAISKAFAYDGSYIAQDTLKHLAGYWLKFAVPETVTVSGNFNPLDTVSVARGWNMIGVPVRTFANDIISLPSRIISSPFFGYSPGVGYSRLDTLKPGRAYWVRCNVAGKIIFGPNGPYLLSPGDGSINQPTMICLRWYSLPTAASYRLQVASNSSFSQPLLLDDSLVVGTTRKFCLGYGVSCFWRVAATYGSQQLSPWSSTWRFTTGFPADSLRWEFLGFPEGGAEVYCMAVNPDNDSMIYVGTASNFSAGTQGSICRTTNLGQTWDTVVAGVSPWVIRINPLDPEIVYAGLGEANATPPGILKTTDGGNTWFWSNQGIYVDWETGLFEIAIDPHNPDTIFAGTAGVFGGTLYKTTDGGGHWFKPNDSATRGEITCLAIHPDTTSIVYARLSFAGRLYRSSNGGNDWELTGLKSDSGGIYAIAFDPVDPQIMYVAVTDNLGRVKKSTDSGWTWFDANQGLTGSSRSGTTLFIRNCTREVFFQSFQAIYESSDLGNTWRTISNLPNGNLIECSSESTDGSYLYIALANTGIFRARLVSGGPH